MAPESSQVSPKSSPLSRPADDRSRYHRFQNASSSAVDDAHENTPLLGHDVSTYESYGRRASSCGLNPCPHGAMSPTGRESPALSIKSIEDPHSMGGRYPGDVDDEENGWTPFWTKLSPFMPRKKQKPHATTTQWLAHRHQVKHNNIVYLGYYFPFIRWISQYTWSFLWGDFVAATTMASFYIPMALSYASNLGHLPPINGLYSFAINPLIYAFLGTCPQMVVGPEAAGSLLLGNVVRSSISKGHSSEDDPLLNSRIAGVVTSMAGLIIFIAGLMRLGYLDSVLSRPFLRGFISAIGFVIFVDQFIPEVGLSELSMKEHVGHSSSVDKIIFIFSNLGQVHALSCYVNLGAFAITMICRELKKIYQPRHSWVAFIPDRFTIVVLSAVLTWAFRWDKQGLEILGEVKSATGTPFSLQFPIIPAHMKHVREALSTSFIISLLGVFESSVAAKSLPNGEDPRVKGVRGMAHSSNRELVALGVANMAGGCFMALPAFGGYGRSKVNSATGGKTGMSSIMLSLITLLCVYVLVPYFYYLPKGVLSAMVSVVAWSLIEECPHDIQFFVKIRGWYELGLMGLIFLATIFYSLPLGIALGLLFSLITVIKHATKPRIQILGRVPGTDDKFENAEDNPQGLEFVEGCLIVKIPEPLTFANTGDLKNRLKRLERYGTNAAHPALPAVRTEDNNRNLIFDVHGVTSIDGSGTQVLYELVEEHISRGVRIFFCRIPSARSGTWQQLVVSGIVDKCGGERNFTQSVKEALALAEKSEYVDGESLDV